MPNENTVLFIMLAGLAVWMFIAYLASPNYKGPKIWNRKLSANTHFVIGIIVACVIWMGLALLARLSGFGLLVWIGVMVGSIIVYVFNESKKAQ